jgi:hypothetical protein
MGIAAMVPSNLSDRGTSSQALADNAPIVRNPP